MLWPKEYPFAHHEMSFLLPYMVKEGRGKLDTYFTRVYNPVWTNPDGFSWIEMLTDEEAVGLHVALTPTWSESAWYADYVLPMGVGSERHDTHSYETHMGQWLGFRQPVLRVAGERDGHTYERTYEANRRRGVGGDRVLVRSLLADRPGRFARHQTVVRVAQRPVASHFGGRVLRMDVRQLRSRSAGEGRGRRADSARVHAEVRRRRGATRHLRGARAEVDADEVGTDGLARRDGKVVGVALASRARPKTGFASPTKKLEWWSKTMEDWGWADESIPQYLGTHVNWRERDMAKGESILIPIFRLPTLIHTRSGNAKYLYEISHGHPLWMNPRDAARSGFATGDMVRINTDTGHFVMRVWRTEGIRPGVVAASHHMGRWRLEDSFGNERWSSALVDIDQLGDGQWRLRQKKGIEPFTSDDPDSERIWWKDAGVHQNLAFPPHPDPISGMHAWHQNVTITKAEDGDHYGDVVVDTNKSFEIYQQWLELTKPGPGPDGTRRPMWLARPIKPTPDAYRA